MNNLQDQTFSDFAIRHSVRSNWGGLRNRPGKMAMPTSRAASSLEYFKTDRGLTPSGSRVSFLLRPFFIVIFGMVVVASSVDCRSVFAVEPTNETKVEFNLDARRAFGYLEEICKLGPRPSTSEGMIQQQELLVEHFTKLGAKVSFQDFDTPHPKKGTPVRMRNLIVSWQPQTKERVLLCCHYDTRPFPDRDPFRPKGTFLGANDGASGVALLMEMGHSLPKLRPTYGVDMVFFDGEEFIFQRDGGKYFLGSEYFAQQYRDRPPAHRYVCGVLADMVGNKNLMLFQEQNSLRLAPRLTRSIWETARTLGVKEFVAKPKPEVNDDHIPLNEIAKIPTTDLIDFDYPAWHTTKDRPSECSGASLVKVARVLLTWLEQVPPEVGTDANRK